MNFTKLCAGQQLNEWSRGVDGLHKIQIEFITVIINHEMEEFIIVSLMGVQ